MFLLVDTNKRKIKHFSRRIFLHPPLDTSSAVIIDILCVTPGGVLLPEESSKFSKLSWNAILFEVRARIEIFIRRENTNADIRIHERL
jgi:hypothetical protein